MLYKYDNAICEDLLKSFNPDNVENPVVKVIGPDAIIGVAAQIKEGNMSFPLVAISRDEGIDIDKERTNFSRIHKGVASVLDNETNMLYYEKCLPINLSYKMAVLTTNTVDMDEMMRELMFKYVNMYYLTIKLPYESTRKIRFGITLDENSTIERSYGSADYVEGGHLHQTLLSLRCEGCVLVSYTPAHLRRVEHEVVATTKEQQNLL